MDGKTMKNYLNNHIYNILMYNRSRSRSREKKKQQRLQIEVRNLPEHVNKEDLIHFLWKTMQSCKGLIKPGNPVVQSAHYPSEGNHVKLMFRSLQEAENCLFLDRLYYGRKVLSITSPYITVRSFTRMNIVKIKKVAHKIQDEFKKIYVGNLPPMDEHEIMNLLSEFGQLKSYTDISKDKTMSECFCEYAVDEATDEALNRLNAMKLKGRSIVAKRAALMNTAQTTKTKITSKTVSNLNRFQKDLNQFYANFDTVGHFKNKNISCVLSLRNIIPINSNVEFILSDIKKQVEKVGPLIKVTHKGLNVYIEYQKVQYSQIAYIILQNRKYDGRMIQVTFYDPIKFADDILI